MTAPTSSTSSSNASQQSSSTAARQSSGTAASTKPGAAARTPAELFANLLGMLSASADEPSGLMSFGVDTSGAQDAGLLDANGLLDEEGLEGSSNPLADLLGWPGAAAHQRMGASMGDSAASGLLPNAARDGAEGSALGRELGANANAGVSLQGMKALAQPVAADAELLARARSGAQPGQSETQSNAPPSDAAALSGNATKQPEDAVSVRYGASSNGPSTSQWRSTATLGANHVGVATSTNATTRAITNTANLQAAQHAAIQQTRVADPSAPTLRGSVTGDESFIGGEAFNDSVAGEPSAMGSLALSSHQQSGASTGQGFQGDNPFGMAGTEESSRNEKPDEVFSLNAEDHLDDDPLPGEPLSPQQMRNASLRVGEGTDEAIDIRLSMEGDAVNVDFRTDNADVRAGIQSNANASLSELMQRSGMQLGGVSVGSNSQQPSGQPGNASQSNGQGNGRSGKGAQGPSMESVGSTKGTAPKPAARRADGGPALDVFA